jgi:hypothetical protein
VYEPKKHRKCKKHRKTSKENGLVLEGLHDLDELSGFLDAATNICLGTQNIPISAASRATQKGCFGNANAQLRRLGAG